MKKRVKQLSGKISSIIGQDVVVEGGIIKGTNGVRIDGTVIGEVHVDGCVVIGATGKIIGNIRSNDILISGSVEGNVYCSGQVYLCKACHVHGDIIYKYIIIDEGAHFTGKCMVEENKDNEIE